MNIEMHADDFWGFHRVITANVCRTSNDVIFVRKPDGIKVFKDNEYRLTLTDEDIETLQEWINLTT